MSFVQQFAAGRPVYGGGSYAPTRGTVDPTGYFKREIRRRNIQQGVSRVGADGVSDTRSGLAARMLAGRQPYKPGGRPVTTGIAQGETNGPGGKAPGGTPGDRDPSSGSNPGGTNTDTPQGPVIPYVEINSNGQLDLPYEYGSDMELLGSMQEFNAQLLALQQQLQQSGVQYAQQSRDAEQGYGNLRRETLSDAASRGTAFSSGYGTSVANNARQFNNYMADLLAGKTGVENDVAAQRAGIERAFNEQLAAIALGKQEALSEEAGSLGYGKSKNKSKEKQPKVPKNKNKNKKKSRSKSKSKPRKGKKHVYKPPKSKGGIKVR